MESKPIKLDSAITLLESESVLNVSGSGSVDLVDPALDHVEQAPPPTYAQNYDDISHTTGEGPMNSRKRQQISCAECHRRKQRKV